ncbi:MAG: DPP IV N-terminal domain-containing protein [Salinivirgaceae bacterium]
MKSYLVIFIALVMSLQLVAQKHNVTIDDLYKNYTFYAKSVYGLNSMNDGLHYSTLENQGKAIVKYSYKTGEVIDTILNVENLDDDNLKSIVDYQFNDSETKIVIYTNRERIYRRSFFADYYVYNLEENKLTKVSEKGRERLATLSPDGKYIAYLRDNNLFVLTIETGDVEQITTDGKWNHIINGAPDWVYEEEFGYNQAFYWSPSSKKIAYCKFDERDVKKFSILKYKGLRPEIEANRLYPEVYDFKYPKAGEDNSVVTVHSYDLDSKSTLTFKTGENTDVYFPRAFWTKQENTLAIVKLNRLQNEMDILYGNANTGETSVVYNEKNKYYIDQPTYENITFIDENQFLFMSEMDGWNQFYIHNTDKKTTEKVTDGDFDVVNYYGFDPKKKTVYYSSTEEGAIYRTVYSIRTDGKKKTKLTERRGSNSAAFSKGFKYYVNYYSNSNQPTLVTLHNEKGDQVRVLEDNAALQDTLENYKISKKTFFDFETSEGVVLNGWMVKPYDFDASKKYPVVMTQYSGPNSQQVLDRWGIDWDQVLAARGFVVVCVDGRGTGGRGEEFRKLTYKELGKYETIDQIETAKHLGNLDFIDKNRIGIYGWSYGGFMALNCMTQGADYFNTGIAVAPVTNWRYYDNIYTERFMQKPQDNADGYDNNSPINHVEKLKGNILIVHGLADDNVHPQNTFEITEALVQADKQFDMAIYTNRNHSIYGGNTRIHLFTKMVNYFVDNLKNN